MKVFEEYGYDHESLEQRIGEMIAMPFSTAERHNILIKLLGFLDLTTLEGSDTEERVVQLCSQARFSSISKDFPDAAAICIYPSLVHVAVNEIRGTAIRVASVAGAFPSGQTSLHVKLEEIKYAIAEGADEIDTVISRGKLIEGKDSEVFDELSAIREICGQVHLKVILETGELPSIALIRKASELAILAGADFIKTSTGKISTGATPVAFLIMLDTIRQYLEKTGKAIGIKPAGGIRTPDQALVYARLLTEVLGEQWLDKDFFRIGASSLAHEIIRELNVGT
ncbi:MAG: deoxyribose-phosphate aldolase [Bacteroidales bacterium]|nr:deoxyribose-phosphate aldolase [Bacteroidales bacterium]